MLIHFQEYLTFENIYLWANFGVLPFWLMLIFSPKSRITQIFVNSVIAPLILAAAYVYVIYQSILLDVPILNFFNLYFILILEVHILFLHINKLEKLKNKIQLRYNICQFC